MDKQGKKHRVLIVGGSLFAESLAQILSASQAVEVAAAVESPEAALAWLQEGCPDVVIGAGSADASRALVGPLLARFPDLPILCADLESDQVHLFTSRPVGTRRTDLLTAIRKLARRS